LRVDCTVYSRNATLHQNSSNHANATPKPTAKSAAKTLGLNMPAPSSSSSDPVGELGNPLVASVSSLASLASGTASLPVPISTMSFSVALNRLCARLISLFSMSNTTYALRRNVSPRTAELPPEGEMPKRQAESCSKELPPPESITSRTSSFMGTEILAGESKWKVIFASASAREHETMAEPCDSS